MGILLLRLPLSLQSISRCPNFLSQSPLALQAAIMSSQALTRQLHPTTPSLSLALLVLMTRMVSSTLASHSMLLSRASAFDSFQHPFSSDCTLGASGLWDGSLASAST